LYVNTGAGTVLLTLIAMTHAYQDVPSNLITDVSAWSQNSIMLGASGGAASIARLQLIEIGTNHNRFTSVLIGITAFGLLCLLPARKLK
jgi:hypothetical protein